MDIPFDLLDPGNWPDLEELAEFADLLGVDPRLSMTAQEILLCMAQVAPAAIAAGVRARARGAPVPMSPALEAMYKKYADQLAEIEALRSGWR